MHYQEFLPHPALRSTVECYWSVHGRSDSFWTVYPDACMDILFNFGSYIETRNEAGPCLRRSDYGGRSTELSRNSAFVIGNMFSPIQSRTTGDVDLFGIRFHAAGMAHIVRVPLFEFNDASLPLESVYRLAPGADHLQSLDIKARVDLIDRWLLKYMSFSSKPEAWEYCLKRIVAKAGNINVHDLAYEVGISQKSMERKFVEKVGPTPKQFAQLLKFRKLREHLASGRDDSLMNVAFDFDFTDHAHLTKFFKKFAGITPSEFTKTG